MSEAWSGITAREKELLIGLFPFSEKIGFKVKPALFS
jgi:hypothetical protein